MGIPKLLDASLGKRVKQAKFKYSDVVLSWIFSIMCGSKRLEDTKHLKRYLEAIPESLHPSPDSIARLFKKMSTPTTSFEAEKAEHEFNINWPLNELLVDVALKLKQINPQANNVLDYDNVLTECEKYDSRLSYKMLRGYFPGVALINKTPVYIENRNGNSLATYQIADTVRRGLDLLESKGIKIKAFRSDAAAYSTSVIKLMEEKKIQFFIRAKNSPAIFKKALSKGTVWETVVIGNTVAKATSVDYVFAGKEYRVVVTKMFDSRRKGENRFSKDKDTLRAIITNCREMTNPDVVAFYNKRGAAELNFTALLNDWNWKRLPFSFLNQNTVFLIMGAIGSVIYQHLIKRFSKKVPFIKTTYRLKKFIFNFITIQLQWVNEAGSQVAYLDDGIRDYSPLFGRPPSK